MKRPGRNWNVLTRIWAKLSKHAEILSEMKSVPVYSIFLIGTRYTGHSGRDETKWN
jgi:hypothetical protein